MIGLLLAVVGALAQEPCPIEVFAQPTETLSVTWISPVHRHAGVHSWLEVVPTTDLRDWIGENDPTLGRFLQRVGLRKNGQDPRSRYKAVIFEVTSDALCRPLELFEEGQVVVGLATCAPGQSRSTSKYAGCGTVTDWVDGSRSFDVYRVRWRDAAARGFCVLPADRFVREGGH